MLKKTIKLIILIFLFLFVHCYSYSVEEETLVIFDASVSMLDDFGGAPKYITAVNETKNVLNMMPETKKIGLRTIGVTIDEAFFSLITNPSNLCKSTKLLVPIRGNSIEYIKNSLDSIFPLGTTPLTYTLDLAINYDFTNAYVLKHIILITDGAESCNGDPCKYIRELMAVRKDIKIDILAIGVKKEDFSQLRCLTDSTNGTIVNITKPDEFKRAFSNFFMPTSNIDVESGFNKIKKAPNIIYKNYHIETYN